MVEQHDIDDDLELSDTPTEPSSVAPPADGAGAAADGETERQLADQREK